MFSIMMLGVGKNHGKQFKFVDENYPREVIRHLDEFRKNGHLGFCDVVLIVQDKHFYAHKNVLASSSDYFFAMFNSGLKESADKYIHIQGIGIETMEATMTYIYTGEVVLDTDNVEAMLQVANLMFIKSLKDACCRFLLTLLTVWNCLGMQRFAEDYACSNLYETVSKFIHDNFSYVTESDEFVSLPVHQLRPLLSRDELWVLNEESFYEAILRWFKYDLKSRKKHFPEFMEHVRFPMMNADYLIDHVEPELLFSQFPECREYLTEAHHYLLLPNRRGWYQTTRTRPRNYENSNEVMVACGGNGDSCSHSTAFSFNVMKGTWAELPRLTQERGYHGVASFESEMFVAGGFVTLNSETMDSVKKFDIEQNSWSNVASLHTRRSKMSMTEWDGLLYVMGGFDGTTTLNSVECYNPTTNRWRYMSPMITRRRCTCAVSSGGSIFVVGGHDGSQILNTVERYDITRDTWTMAEVPAMAERRSFPCSVVIDDDVYVIGGYDGVDTLRTCEVYSTTSNTWRSIEPMNVARSNAGAAYLHRKIYVVGGWDGVSLGSVEFYDTVTHEWSRCTSLPRPTTGVRCCILYQQTSNEQKPKNNKQGKMTSCTIS